MGITPFLAYEASAGSGKTFNLVVRYLSLLFNGASIDTIVALTFTNKAANEMSERIVNTLRYLHTKRYENERMLIIKSCQLDETSLQERQHELVQALFKHSPSIMTIDTFLVKILRKFSLYLSLKPTFTIAEQQHDVKVLQRFLQRVLSANQSEALIALKDQLGTDLPALLQFFSNLYTKSFELPSDAKTFTSLDGYEADVFHALDALSAWIHGCEKASETAKKSFQATQIKEVLNKGYMARDSLNYRTFSKCFEPQADHLFEELKASLQHYCNQYEANVLASLFSLLEHFIKAKRDVALQDNEIGFDDIAYEVYQLFHTIEDREFIRFRLNQSIEHILLDEFQDTSTLQYAILAPFIEEITAGDGLVEAGTFFFVGDVKQSIYRFRGGASTLFHSVASQFNVRVETLNVNYRSSKNVVAFVNDTFATKIKDFTQQYASSGAPAGYVEVIEDDDVIAQTIKKVTMLLDANAVANSIAVLCRNNNDVRAIETALLQQNIATQTESATLLIHQKNIQALISLLRYFYFEKEKIYAEEFFALTNKKVDPYTNDIDWYKPLVEIVHGLVVRYELFDLAGNMMLFMQVVQSYYDIESLLFSIERDKTIAKKVQRSGVNLLTIHKSKGLEYEHVIVIDTLRSNRNFSEMFLYDYENIHLRDIFVYQKNRQSVDARYALAFEKEEQLQHSDALNVLYVALTRAKLQLFIIKKSKQSAFEMLELRVMQQGELNRYDEMPPRNDEVPPQRALSWRYYGTQANLLSKEESTTSDKILFGTLLHFLLEMMSEFSDDALHEAIVQAKRHFAHKIDEKMVLEAKERIISLLKNEQFMALIRSASSIVKEQPLRFNQRLYYVDLLLEYEDRVVIIDYKSGSFGNSAHSMQVEHYVKMIKTFQSKAVSATIVYLLESQIKLVDVSEIER